MNLIKTPVSRVGNKTALLPIIYSLFPNDYTRFVDVFGGSGSVLLGSPYPCGFEVYNDFDHNLANLFHCMKERTMAVIRELGFCNLNARDDFNAIRRFFQNERFDDKYFQSEQELTEIMLKPPDAAELNEIRSNLTADYDVRRAAMFLKLLRYSYSSGGKSFAAQPFDITSLFGLIGQLQDRLVNVIIENQDFAKLIPHYDRTETLFYLDPPYYMKDKMYACDFDDSDHVRLRDLLLTVKGKCLISYNDCPEIRELFKGFCIFDFSRTHSMVQRYEAGKQYPELLIGNYDLFERARNKPRQMTLFDDPDQLQNSDKILKECIVSCKIKC